MIARALARGGELVPVDSEHSAALLCLGGRPAEDVATLTLTASGGALRTHPDWRKATRDEVLAHPVWRMGPRITVDSALLFNQGLELIEAHWLFGLGWDQLDACLHPETLVHAMVAFRDGAMTLQAAPADMRLPIQMALSWPAHWEAAVPALAPADLAGLHFDPIAAGRYPAFDVALAAGRTGGTAPCALNAADEEYRLDRLRETCLGLRARPLPEVVKGVGADLAQFVRGLPFHDDRTIVLARRAQRVFPELAG